MEPNSKIDLGQKTAGKKINNWFIVSVILAIALISILAVNFYNDKKDGLIVLPTDQAADTLVDFINKIYGPKVGLATLKEVTEKNGLYEVIVSVANNNETVDQTIFITRDGKLFIPQVINIEDVLVKFEEFQQQQQSPQPQPTPNLPTE